MNYSINMNGKIFLIDEPKVMGILNVTDDSFYSGSRVNGKDGLLEKAEKMIFEGVDIIDVGAYSTRPGAVEIPEDLEKERIAESVGLIRNSWKDVVISVDTFRSEVLKAGFEKGAEICNDISGGSLDKNFLQTVSELKMPYILMHLRGNPKTMNTLTNYDDILLEMIEYFKEKIALLRSMGLQDFIIDPGFGFAKTSDQNFYLLKNLSAFEIFDRPLLAGISRKSMIYKTLNTSPERALNGTTALNMIALLNGANLLRVHDVKEARETIKLYKKYRDTGIY